MLRAKGYEARGPDPAAGRGGYVNLRTGRSYHIDLGGNYRRGREHPHVDVNRPARGPLPKRRFYLQGS
jgi:hypothetical protein